VLLFYKTSHKEKVILKIMNLHVEKQEYYDISGKFRIFKGLNIRL